MAKCKNCGNKTNFSQAGYREKTGLCPYCYKQVKRGAAEDEYDSVRYFYDYWPHYFTSTPWHPHFDSGYTAEEMKEMLPEEVSGELTPAGVQNARANWLASARVHAAIGLVNGPSMLFL